MSQLAQGIATAATSQGGRPGTAGSPSRFPGARNLSQYFNFNSTGGASSNIFPVNGGNVLLQNGPSSSPVPAQSGIVTGSGQDLVVSTQSQQEHSFTTSSVANFRRSPRGSGGAKGSSSSVVAASGGSRGVNTSGVVCLVLEYLAGGSLQAASESGVLHDRQGVVDLQALWPLLVDVARGMAALHAMGVCHGGECGRASGQRVGWKCRDGYPSGGSLSVTMQSAGVVLAQGAALGNSHHQIGKLRHLASDLFSQQSSTLLSNLSGGFGLFAQESGIVGH